MTDKNIENITMDDIIEMEEELEYERLFYEEEESGHDDQSDKDTEE